MLDIPPRPVTKSSEVGRPVRVAFVVNTLTAGGTERNVLAFCRSVDRSRFVPEVHTLLPVGQLTDAVTATGVTIKCHHRTHAYSPWAALRCARTLADVRVDIMHVFSHAAAVNVALARRLFGLSIPLIYSEGTSLPKGGWRYRLDCSEPTSVRRVCRQLSRVTDQAHSRERGPSEDPLDSQWSSTQVL